MRLSQLLKKPQKKTIVVPMAHNDQVIKCVNFTKENSHADFILLGDKEEILSLGKKFEVDLSDTEILAESDEARACERAVQLVNEGKGQVLMKGVAQSSTFLRSILNKKNNLKTGALISHVSVFDIPTYYKALFITDAGINISPTIEQKVEILKNALSVARGLGVLKPKVACIAPTEKINSKIQSTIDAHNLTSRKNSFGDALVDGPFGLDIAVSKSAAVIKEVMSPVAGDADIILLPDLNTGNAVYKSLTTFARATTAGIIAGLKVPVVLTSQTDTDEAKRLSLLTALCIGNN